MNSVNIETLHENMKVRLKEKFPACNVGYYERPGDKVPTPALLIQLDDLEVDDGGDVGTEQVEATLRFNLYCVYDFRAGSKLKVRSLAASVIAFIRGKRWGVEIGPAIPDGAHPDWFKKGNPPSNEETNEYEVYRVDFHHEGMLGEDVWEYDGEAPTNVFVSTPPHIGLGNEENYFDVTEDRT